MRVHLCARAYQHSESIESQLSLTECKSKGDPCLFDLREFGNVADLLDAVVPEFGGDDCDSEDLSDLSDAPEVRRSESVTDFSCKICHELMYRPVTLSTCGHTCNIQIPNYVT